MLATYNADDQFPVQSVYKLPIGMAAMELVDRGTLSLDQMVRVGGESCSCRSEPLVSETRH